MMRTSRAIRAVNQFSYSGMATARGGSGGGCQSLCGYVHQSAGDIAQSRSRSPERLISGIKHRS